jgi:hypothetical protein
MNEWQLFMTIISANCKYWGLYRAILYTEGDKRLTEGESVDDNEVAQTQSVRIIVYLKQYPHLKIRHTSCSMVTTVYSY